jgi:glycosyltransferase involved in cell wall biosynthesis
MDMPDNNSLIWKLDQNLCAPFVVGEGSMLYLSGWCYHARRRIKRLGVLVNGRLHRIINHSTVNVELFSSQPPHLDKTGRSLTSGFWTTLPFHKISDPTEAELTLQAVLDNGETCQSPIGKLALLPAVERRAVDCSPNESESNGERLVALCLATYNPQLDLFASQIESLIGQTHQNWLCIINDDCSTEASWECIQRIAARDRRFRVSRNAERLGFYRNFERCLQLVPADAAFVALADQDDYWYPYKLEKCLAAFQKGTGMVYSDMEVAARGGEVISKTLWATRENNYTDLEALLYANTVTGASIVLQASLLDELLPFPNLPGDAYHDHWIACVALTKGAIGYVAEPLYTWRQHEGNACGFAITQPSRIKRWIELKTFIYLLVLFLRRSRKFGAYLTCLQQQYRNYFVGIVVLAHALQLRVKDAPEDKRAILERFIKFEQSLPVLAVQASKCRMLKKATLGRELSCFRVALSVRLINIYCRWARPLFQQQRSNASPPDDFPATPTNLEARCDTSGD